MVIYLSLNRRLHRHKDHSENEPQVEQSDPLTEKSRGIVHDQLRRRLTSKQPRSTQYGPAPSHDEEEGMQSSLKKACVKVSVDRYTSHVIFLMHFCTQSDHAYHTAWLKTSHPMCLCSAHSFHLHTIHDVCLSVHCLSLRVGPSPVSLCCLPLLFLILPALCPALHLQCQQRREK